MTTPMSFQVKLAVPYDEALLMVESALKEEGFGVLTRIDIQAAFKEKIDQEFRPYAILGACNPTLAHRVLSHDAELGILLPCNVTVEAGSDGGSIVRAVNPDAMLATGGDGQDAVVGEVAKEARKKLQRVIQSLEESDHHRDPRGMPVIR